MADLPRPGASRHPGCGVGDDRSALRPGAAATGSVSGLPALAEPRPGAVPPLSRRAPPAVMAEGSGSAGGASGRGPPCPGAASAFRRWEQLRRRAATPWARGLLAAAAGLGLLYAVLRVPVRLRDGLAAGEGGRGERRAGGRQTLPVESPAVSGLCRRSSGTGQGLSRCAAHRRAAPHLPCARLGPVPKER